MCEKLFEKCKQDVEKSEREDRFVMRRELSKNPRQGHKLLYHFINQFSATLPLWTRIALPCRDLTPPHFPIYLNTHNERFRLVKSLLAAHDEDKESLDVLIRRLHDENRALVEQSVKLFCPSLTENSASKINRTTCSTLKQLLKTNEENEVIILDDEDEEEDSVYFNDDNSQNYSIDFLKRKNNRNDLIKIKSQEDSIKENTVNPITTPKLKKIPSDLNENSSMSNKSSHLPIQLNIESLENFEEDNR